MAEIREDIDGAPFAIGAKVFVWQVVDDSWGESSVGKEGVLEYYEYDCGCSQEYPRDPMIGVRFPDGSLEEYWREELAEP